MQKDLKIGMVLGLVLAAVAVIWLATRPRLSTKARMQKRLSAAARETPPSPELENVEARRQTAEQLIPLAVTKSTEDKQRTTNNKQNEQQNTISHLVQRGESLSGISYKYYGSANKWRQIYNANRNVIKNANKLKPGTKLIIPQ